MKAVIINKELGLPQIIEIDTPKPKADNEALITVKAVAIKNIDKSRASNTHYSTKEDIIQKIIGSDGVGILEDGTRAYAIGLEGMLAEKAIVNKNMLVSIPNNLDCLTAAALPNAVIGSAMGLKCKAQIKKGDIVLINGGTGVTGKIAIQIAKYYGAKEIIATGRNKEKLNSLLALGATQLVEIKDDGDFFQTIKKLHKATPFNIIIDYLCGKTAELILLAIQGKGAITQKTNFVSIGAITGGSINLTSEILRNTNIEISGSGLGSWSQEEIQLLFKEILPEMFQLASNNQLKIETISYPIEEIESIWNKYIPSGKKARYNPLTLIY